MENKKQVQINNLTIRWYKISWIWRVLSPPMRDTSYLLPRVKYVRMVLKEFQNKEDAIEWASEVTDYLNWKEK